MRASDTERKSLSCTRFESSLSNIGVPLLKFGPVKVAMENDQM
jgi:hypothetical protein